MSNFSLTFATLNCLNVTKQCLESILASGVDARNIVIVDNGSTDGTREHLQQLDLGNVILNRQNLSCGAAWNQGILANQSEWTIVMNNDVIVTKDFAKKLISFASENKLKLVSPARIDGILNYDFYDFSSKAQNLTGNAIRWGSSNAICMCIHWSLFEKIGFFRADPNLLGFEDGLFYNEIRKHQIRHATTGSVWIHHFGKATQDHMKLLLGIPKQKELVRVNDRKLYGQSWLERKYYRYQLKRLHTQWRDQEISNFKISLHGIRNESSFLWI
jgi:GT2 family glycosyltransferase